MSSNAGANDVIGLSSDGSRGLGLETFGLGDFADRAPEPFEIPIETLTGGVVKRVGRGSRLAVGRLDAEDERAPHRDARGCG